MKVCLQSIVTRLTTWYIFSEMELVNAFFQPTLQEMFHETMLKMRLMDVEQHQSYLKNLQFLILKVAEDCHVLNEYPTEIHDDHGRGNPNSSNYGICNHYPSVGDVVTNRLWEIYQACER